MKYLLQLEELAMVTLGIIGLYLQPIHIYWWLWPFVFLSPDLSMLGYIVNTKIGAWCYNLAHHKGLAILLAIIGYKLQLPVMQFTGILLWSHSCYDRVLGYGLKHESSFSDTHLGVIGKKKQALKN